MVRNNALEETSAATKLIAETVAAMIRKAGWSQAKTGTIIDKSQSYDFKSILHGTCTT